MLNITDGRSLFFQWDVGQRLELSLAEGERVNEVHIGNDGADGYYIVEPLEGFVAVPDELLQNGKRVIAYEYVTTADEGHTVRKNVFNVAKRPKAEGYTFTPTSAQSWEYWANESKRYAELSEGAVERVPQTMTEWFNAHRDEFKGADGYTPIKGKDYFDGKDGYTPVKGVDYFDGKDGADGKDATPYDDTEIRGLIADKVDDVKINGSSIVADGVANIPQAQTSVFGVVQLATQSAISARSTNRAITTNQFDYAVKSALCDGKGAEWDNLERVGFAKRVGNPREHIKTLVTEEDVNLISIDLSDNQLSLAELNIRTIPSGTTPSGLYVKFFCSGQLLGVVNLGSAIHANANLYCFAKAERIDTTDTYSHFQASGFNGGGSLEYTQNATGNSYYNSYRKDAVINRIEITSPSVTVTIKSGTIVQIFGIKS